MERGRFLAIYFAHLHKKSLKSSRPNLGAFFFFKSRKQFQGLNNLIDWDP